MAKKSAPAAAPAPAVQAKKDGKAKAAKKEEAVAAAPVKESKKDKKSKKAPAKEPTPPPVEESSEEEDSDEDDEEDSDEEDSDSDEEEAKPAANGAAAAAAPAAEEDSSDDDSEEDSSDEEEEAAPKAAAEAEDSSDDDEEDDEEEDSSDDDEEDEEEEAKPAQANKRKASAEPAAEAKKAKTETNGENEPQDELFVGQLSWNVDNDWLYSEFEQFGEIVSHRVITDRATGRSKGMGFVKFGSIENATSAMEAMNGKEVDGRNIRVNYAGQRPPVQDRNDRSQQADRRGKQFGDKPQGPPTASLFIGSLSFDANEDSIYEAFGEFGDVQRVAIPKDRETGAPKGYGWIDFADVESATKALQGMNGQEINGRPIRLDYNQPRDQSSGGGFGGNGGGGGFGGRGGGRGGRGGFGGDRGGRGGGRGGFGGRGGGDRGGRGGRGGARGGRGGARTGGIVQSEGSKVTFD